MIHPLSTVNVIQISAATLAGQYIGAQDFARARHSVIITCAVATAIMAAAGVVFYVAAVPLSAFFLGNQNAVIVPLAARLLRIVAYAMPPLALTMVLVGALRGAGDTRWPLALNLLGIAMIRVPLATYLAYGTITVPILDYTIRGLDLGVVGAWYGLVIDVSIRCVLLIFRFQHDGWQRINV